MLPVCWMAWPRPQCFAHMGKFGDLMIMLPAFKAIHDATGTNPVCIVARQFASILEGVSYVTAWACDLIWWADVFKARAMGEQRFGHCIVPKWWDEPNAKAPGVNLNSDPANAGWNQSYQTSQWCYAGFTMQQFREWPLVFDRRDAKREEELRKTCFKTDKPKLLLSLNAGGTSPFPYIKLVRDESDKGGLEVVDLQQVRAHRIYDLLGLYDHAAGLVTSDTATLHLAGASPVPYVAFINTGARGSVPKGNCVLSVRHDDVPGSANQIAAALHKMAA